VISFEFNANRKVVESDVREFIDSLKKHKAGRRALARRPAKNMSGKLATAEKNECETYRVIVLRRHGKEVPFVPDRDRFALPAVEIPLLGTSRRKPHPPRSRRTGEKKSSVCSIR